MTASASHRVRDAGQQRSLLVQATSGAPRTVPLALLVAFLLATGRWGSYIGLPSRNIFVTEVGLILAFLWWSIVRRDHFEPRSTRALLPLGALMAWSLIRFATGGQYDLTAVRDLAPYMYVVAAVAACWAVRSTATTRALIEGALIAHLLWLLAPLLAPEWADSLPILGGKVRVFELRHDFDGAALAILICLSGLRARQRGLSKAIRGLAIVVLISACYVLLQLGTRAGVIALATALFALSVPRLHSIRRIQPVRLAVVSVILVGLGALVLPHTYLFERLTGDESNSDSATGTFIAREEAWSLVLADATRNPTRVIIGSGFGPDFLERSGAAVWFEGRVEKGVRAPHNFLINTMARLGLVGVALLMWSLVAITWAVLPRRRSRPHTVTAERDGLDDVALLCVATLFMAGLVGVILEAPFGAVPFWWATGFILVRHHSSARSRVAAAAPPSSSST